MCGLDSSIPRWGPLLGPYEPDNRLRFLSSGICVNSYQTAGNYTDNFCITIIHSHES
jgi:hypothetical protein